MRSHNFLIGSAIANFVRSHFFPDGIIFLMHLAKECLRIFGALAAQNPKPIIRKLNEFKLINARRVLSRVTCVFMTSAITYKLYLHALNF